MMKKLVIAVFLAAPPMALGQPSPPSPAPSEAAKAGQEEIDEEGDLSRAVVEKLSQEQLMQVLHERSRSPEPPALAQTVPIAFFILVLLIVALSLYAGLRKDQQRSEVLRALIEKGAPLPAELLVPPSPGKSDLRRGLVLVGAGLGLMVMLAALADRGVWTAGLLPLLMGAGYLLTWKLEPASPRPSAPQRDSR